MADNNHSSRDLVKYDAEHQEVGILLRSVSDVTEALSAGAAADDVGISRAAKVRRRIEDPMALPLDEIMPAANEEANRLLEGVVNGDVDGCIDDDDGEDDEGSSTSIGGSEIMMLEEYEHESEEEDDEELFSDDEDESDDEGGDEELCEETLLRIKGNDPTLTSLAVHGFSSSDNGDDRVVDFASEAGRSIGANKCLRRLAIKGESMEWSAYDDTRARFRDFCSGVEGNRSIEQYSLRDCLLVSQDEAADTAIATTIMTMLSPCFEHTASLHSLKITGCAIGNEGTHLLALALSQRRNKSSVRRISLDANEIGDLSGESFVRALQGYDNLTQLTLGDNELGSGVCEALGNFLPSSTLEKLNLENNCIDDNGIAALTNALLCNTDTTLKDLNLSFNRSITQAGWLTFSKCLQQRRRPDTTESLGGIEKLDISSNNITDEGAMSLGKSLIGNTSLRALNFYDLNSDGIPLVTTSTGWQVFFACLHCKESTALEELDLRYNSLDEQGLPALANALSNNTTVKILDLSHNHQISATRWQSFFSSLLECSCASNNNFAIKELHLCGNNITDNVMSNVFRILSDNETLETLVLGENPSISSEWCWNSLRRLLCDTSSITNVFDSNHTLSYVDYNNNQSNNIPEDVDSLLQLNRRSSTTSNKRDVAREKILQFYFQNGMTNVQECLIFGMKLKVLPRAISWMCRDTTGRALLFETLRGLPSLFARETTTPAKTFCGFKRRRCLT